MRLVGLVAQNFSRLPYPAAGIVILVLVALLSLVLSWRHKLGISVALTWLAALCIFAAPLVEELQWHGDGFGQIFLLFHGAILFVFASVVSGASALLNARKGNSAAETVLDRGY
jgi:hypothetical protein